MLKRILIVLVIAILLSSYSIAQEIEIEWENADTQCVGFTIYWGEKSGVYTNKLNVGAKLSARIDPYPLTHAYISVVCYNKDGEESQYSDEIEWGVSPPQNIRVEGQK